MTNPDKAENRYFPNDKKVRKFRSKRKAMSVLPVKTLSFPHVYPYRIFLYPSDIA